MLASRGQGIRWQRFGNLAPCGSGRNSCTGAVSRERSDGVGSAGLCRGRDIALKQHFEIEPKPPMVIPEEDSVLRIGDVGVHCERIEVIGKVVARHR